MAEGIGKVLLMGPKRLSSRSTVANMLVNGGLNICPLEPIDATSICQTYVGRGWTVVDTMGFGEPIGCTVPDEYARQMTIDFLQEVKGSYTHIIFVVHIDDIFDRHYPKDRVTMPPPTSIVWKTFLDIFKGGEENFVVLVTGSNRSVIFYLCRTEIEEMFPECKQFLYMDFPEDVIDLRDPEEYKARTRQEELEDLEKEMKEMFKASPWVEPDIFKMGDEEIEKKAVGITQQIITQGRKIRTMPYKITTYETKVQAQGSSSSRQSQMIAYPLRDLLNEKSEMISQIRDKTGKIAKKVKFYRRQCECLLQKSLEASKEVLDLCGGTGTNWEQYSLAPLISSLDKFGYCMKAVLQLLDLCGDSTEQRVAQLTLSPPPFRDSFSKFDLVLRKLDWSLDALRLLIHNPEAGHATGSERQSWLSKFIWCEERCRLVCAGDSDSKVTDADRVKSSLAADRQDLISFSDSQWWFQTLGNRRSTSSESEIFMSILKNRFQGDSTFTDPNRVPGCFLLPEKVDYKDPRFIGGGGYKDVHKCKWLGMTVAIANFHDHEGASQKAFETEAALLARVQHPNVITLIGYADDEEEKQGYLVTELMETSLREVIDKYMSNRIYGRKEYPFSLQESIDILLQIVEAMIHVHECGVIHRDLKSLNCLVNRGDTFSSNFQGYVVKLIDFGTSQLRSSEMGTTFNTPNIGTRAWMAPEVYRKEGDETIAYTWSADVYSFGMTCYEILTGEEPFGTIRGRALAKMVSDGHRPIIPDDCPDGLRELMAKCWAQIPEDRPSFKEIRQILWDCKLYYTIWGEGEE